MKPKWILARLTLATLPFLSLLLWTPTLGGYLRTGLWFFATFTPLYLMKWPKILDENGEGIAGVWGLRATCRCYSSPPTPMFPGKGLVCVSNEGYETKICVYNTYLFSSPSPDELPPRGEPCRPGFTASKPLPPIVFSRMGLEQRSREVVAVAWEEERGAAAYLKGGKTYTVPRILKPPRLDTPYTDLIAHVDYFSAARELAYSLLDRAKPNPAKTEGVRIGVDEWGREYRLPLRHVGVFGSTGCGKSSTLALIASRLAEKGYNVWVVDPYGEYRLEGFETLYSVPNPFELKTPEETADLLETASMIVFGPERGAYSPIVRQVLLQALRKTGDLGQAIAELEKNLTAGGQDIATATAAALRRLEPIRKIKWRSRDKSIPRRAVFDVSLLPPMARVLAVNSILEKAWENGDTVVVVDEAGSLARIIGRTYVTLPSLEKTLTLGRSRRALVALADQYADRIPQALLGQLVKLWMRHMPPLPLSAPPSIRHMLPTLRVGEAISDDGTLVRIDPPPSRLRTKTAALLDKVSLEELESFINGVASDEVKIKLWILGLARGKELTRIGKKVYNILKGNP